MAFAGVYLAIAADNLAVASHNMAFGPIILALGQKSRSSKLKNELPPLRSHSIIHIPQLSQPLFQ